MKITLKINGDNRDFTVGYINMLTVRRAMEIQELIDNGKIDLARPTPAQLDMIVDFVVLAFENQFTRQEFYQGWSAKGFLTKLLKVISQIIELLIATADELGE